MGALGAAALAGWGIKKGIGFVSNLIKSRKSKKTNMSSPANSQTEFIPSQEVLPFVPEKKEEPVPQQTKEEDRPPLVPVSGNPKVMRCLNCKTFVSANSDHRYKDCDLRLARKASKQHTKSTSPKPHKRVDKNLVKSFRKLEKENAKTTQLKSSISKKASALIKKYKKQDKKTTKIPKQILTFLDFVTKKIH